MGRRKDNEVPVSLFAFQDIITSITGIMILVVLLIILDILDAPNAKKTSPFKEDVAKLEKTVKRLREELDKESKWLNKNENEILKAASVELSALPKLIEKEKRRFLLLTTALNTEKNKNSEAETLIAAIKKKVKKVGEDVTKTKNEKKIAKGVLDEKLAELDVVTKQLAEAKKENEKRQNRVEIRTDKNLGLDPVLVECSKTLIKTKDIKSQSMNEFKSANGDKRVLVRKFYAWMKKSLASSKNLVIVIVKPSSVEYALTVVGMLKGEGFKYNIEPMDENKTGVYE